MASNSDQSLVLAFGGFFQFLGPTKPFGSLLRCCCCAIWLEQMISTVFWPTIFTLKHSRLFAQLVDFGASSLCDRYKGRDSEGSHCQGKARSSSWLFKSRTSPTGKGRKGQRAAEEGWSRQTKQEEAATCKWQCGNLPVVLKSTESSRSIVAVCQADKDGTLRKDETSYRLADVCRAQYYSVAKQSNLNGKKPHEEKKVAFAREVPCLSAINQKYESPAGDAARERII